LPKHPAFEAICEASVALRYAEERIRRDLFVRPGSQSWPWDAKVAVLGELDRVRQCLEQARGSSYVSDVAFGRRRPDGERMTISGEGILNRGSGEGAVDPSPPRG
jgi:hypothetical protein